MKNKKRKAALYDPYLDTLGGGEQYVLHALKALEEEGYDVTVFWKEDLQKQIKQKFNIHFKNLHVDTEGFHGNKNAISRWWHLGNYDVFFYITDGSYFFSGAKKNFVYAMVPRKDLYQISGTTNVKLSGWKFIANSKFTASFLKQWNIQSLVHYPCLPDPLLKAPDQKKEKIILNVGRFFGHLHKKNHEEIIYTFIRLQKNAAYRNYKLVLAGGLREEDEDYFKRVKSAAAKNKNIELKPNMSYEELVDLYEKSMFYWHFTGLGINEREHPEQVEHLGITPLEAMAAGAVVCAFCAGGPKEIIEQGKNGFLFTSEDELIQIMKNITSEEIRDISKYGRSYTKAHFSWPIFKRDLLHIVNS